MRRLLTVVLTLALLGGTAAAAPADPFELVAERAAGPPVTDGARYAALMLDGRTLRVFDHGRGGAFDATLPDTCSDPVELTDVGGGQALVNCGGNRWHGRPLLLDLTTAVWHEPPGAARVLEQAREGGEQAAAFTEVGSHWLGGAISDHFVHPLWLEWHSGVFRDEEGDAAHVPDLDAEDLYVPLCRPLWRPPAGDQGEARWDPFPYRRPYALVEGEVRRCGAARDVRLPGAGDDAQLGVGSVSWIAGDAVRVAELWCGVRYGWTVPNAVAAMRAGPWLYVAQATGSLDAPRYRVRRVALPWCPVITHPRAVRVRSGGALRIPRLTTWSTSLTEGSPRLLPSFDPRPRPLVLRPGATVDVRAYCVPRTVRWRIGAGPWRAAREVAFRTWRFRAPASLAADELSLGVRCDLGRGRFRLPLRSR